MCEITWLMTQLHHVTGIKPDAKEMFDCKQQQQHNKFLLLRSNGKIVKTILWENGFGALIKLSKHGRSQEYYMSTTSHVP